MKHRLFILVLFCNFISAQLCSYDNFSIIVVKVHENGNQNTIPNLHLTLIKKKKGKIKKSPITLLYQMGYLPFISDEYYVQVPNNFKMQNLYLRIESVYVVKKGSSFTYGTTEIKVSETDKYPICELSDSYQNRGILNKRVFNALEIILNKKYDSSD